MPYSVPIRDDAGNRLFDAVYNPDGTINLELKIARQKLVITLDAVRAQIAAGECKAKQTAPTQNAPQSKKKR